jgi:carboxypeptidase Q
MGPLFLARNAAVRISHVATDGLVRGAPCAQSKSRSDATVPVLPNRVHYMAMIKSRLGISVLFAALTIAALASSLFAQNKPQSSQQASSWSSAPQMSAAQQENFPPELMNQLQSIEKAALIDDYAYRQLAHLTDNIGPRLSGSPQANAAVEYVAAQMRDLGLDVHLEDVKVPHWVRGAETAALVEYPGQVPGTTQKIVLTALGGSTATPSDGLTADVVVVNTFEELKSLGREKVAGKVVLFNEKFDKQKAAAGLAFAAYGEAVRYRGAGPKTAAESGAVAALVRSVGNADYRLPHTGFSAPAGIPAAAVTAEDADLIAHLASQGTVRVHLTITPQKLPDEASHNVTADLKGSEHPEQLIVVSGHLDSWDLGTGAIDDGAGVVVAMEAAELLQRLHLHPKRTIRVIAWMDEETGGSGAKTYAREHAAELANHIAAIESDGGAAHPLGFEAKMSKAALDAIRPALTALDEVGSTVLQETSYPPGADISPMSQAGVPALGLMQDGRTYFNYHHTAADTLDKVVPAELRENAAAMAVMAYALANMKNPLPR